MSIKMDAARIAKWKCMICGSRYKKVVHAMKNGTEQGFSMVCCDCGHTHNFVSQFDAIPMYTVGLNSGRVTDIKITCGCSEYDKDTCGRSDCNCRIKEEVPPPTPPSVTTLKRVATEEHLVSRNRMLSIK